MRYDKSTSAIFHPNSTQVRERLFRWIKEQRVLYTKAHLGHFCRIIQIKKFKYFASLNTGIEYKISVPQVINMFT